MRVRAITPIRVTDEELDRRRHRYHRLSPAGVLVDLENLREGPDTPRQLDSDDAVAVSDRLMIEAALDTDPAVHDLVLPDCVLDPGVDSGKETPVPVVGILQLAAGHLAAVGQRFSAVTRNQPIGDELVDRLDRYGLRSSFAGLEVLDLDFEAISDDGRWHETLLPIREQAGREGADAIINGCSAVEVPPGDSGAAVVDPTRLALELLGVAAGHGFGAHR